MIIATAGHVDHGKTSLVRALTGMETDRLAEEKRRGLSINLGFAYRHSDKGTVLAFVDVPGHIRFINNMIAGISAIDLGMLVIAADDGPMPQTREHLDVLKLLGVKNYIVVITKIDRVEEDRLSEVREKAMALFAGEDPPVIFNANNIDGSGVDALADYLESMAASNTRNANSGYFRFPIDRVFTIKGSGLVVTGTVVSGVTSINDTLTLLPQGKMVRVRSMQAQEDDVSKTGPGQRCALNISGDIEKEDIERGDWLVGNENAPMTVRFDCQIRLLDNAPFQLKHMSPVKLYAGAGRSPARIALLAGNTLQPGENTKAQIMLLDPVHICAGDRFLLRDDSESETLGGGIVLDIHAPGRSRSSNYRIKFLEKIDKKNPFEVLQTLCTFVSSHSHRPVLRVHIFGNSKCNSFAH